MSLLHHIKDRTEAIAVVKFCPNAKSLAVGGKDTKIIIYGVLCLLNSKVTRKPGHKLPVRYRSLINFQNGCIKLNQKH